MTYLTSHTPVPRTVLRPMNDDERPVGMPNESDLAALMIRAAKEERKAVAKRDGTGHKPRPPRGEDLEAKRMAELKEADNQRMVQHIRENPGLSINDALAFSGKTMQATRNQLYRLAARGFIVATRRSGNAATTYTVTE